MGNQQTNCCSYEFSREDGEVRGFVMPGPLRKLMGHGDQNQRTIAHHLQDE